MQSGFLAKRVWQKGSVGYVCQAGGPREGGSPSAIGGGPRGVEAQLPRRIQRCIGGGTSTTPKGSAAGSESNGHKGQLSLPWWCCGVCCVFVPPCCMLCMWCPAIMPLWGIIMAGGCAGGLGVLGAISTPSRRSMAARGSSSGREKLWSANSPKKPSSVTATSGHFSSAVTGLRARGIRAAKTPLRVRFRSCRCWAPAAYCLWAQ